MITYALEEFGMTFRFEGDVERQEWISYPTNIDGTCDFDDGTSVAVAEWEQATPGEIAAVIERLEAMRVAGFRQEAPAE